MKFDTKRNIAFFAVVLIALIICGVNTAYWLHESRETPQEKVFELANEIKGENSAVCVVLFTLSGSMLSGDEKRLASMMGIYAQTMKDSLEALEFNETE